MATTSTDTDWATAQNIDAHGVVLRVTRGTSGQVVIDHLSVTPRNHGHGSTIMRTLCTLADQHGDTLALTPGILPGTTSVRRLTRFYRDFGFRPNTGRRADHSISQSMIRTPFGVPHPPPEATT